MSDTTRLFTPTVIGGVYPGESLPDGRAVMSLSEDDAHAWAEARAGTSAAVITDQNTGTRWLVRAADCGADCRCAAVAEPVTPTSGAGGSHV